MASQLSQEAPPKNLQSTLQNRTIFCRDNLEILRGINSDSIDLIYLDPPFNKQKTFHAPLGSKSSGAEFKDTWEDKDIKNEWVGLIADEEPVLHNYLNGVERTGDPSNKYYLVFMAVRLLEMRRVLKATGSLYVHCDPTMSHYLKVLLDTIFGHQNFRNEIVWRRTGRHSDSRSYGNAADKILFYSGGGNYYFSKEHASRRMSDKGVKRRYSKKDDQGFYRIDRLDARGLSGGGYEYSYKGVHDLWRCSKEKMLELEKDRRIHWTERNGKPQRPYKKVYLKNREDCKVRLQNIWTDINIKTREVIGYPTQKPRALLERIIQASSKEGDLILDPFCGCATTCVAAELLKRRWVGIDVSPKAYELVQWRLEREVANPENILQYKNKIIFREDLLQRTDFEQGELKDRLSVKHLLYGSQQGFCAGCKMSFDFRHLEVDHIVPRSKGGGDNEGNLQLLCAHCNRVKGDRDMSLPPATIRRIQLVTCSRSAQGKNLSAF